MYNIDRNDFSPENGMPQRYKVLSAYTHSILWA